MEPDILASAAEPGTGQGSWERATTVQSTEGSPTVEIPSDITKPHVVRLPAVSAQAPVSPRMRSHPGGFASGHARPRGTAPLAWQSAPALASTLPGVMPFETPGDQGLYLRAGKRFLDVIGAACALVVLAPVSAVLAIIVRATSRGPVFYRST